MQESERRKEREKPQERLGRAGQRGTDQEVRNIRLRIVLYVFSILFFSSAFTGFLITSFPLKFLPAAALSVLLATGMGYLASRSLSAFLMRSNRELRRRLEANFRETTTEKLKLETILKQMADGMVAVDAAGRIIHANNAARTMLRISEDDIRTRRYDDIIRRFSDDLCLSDIISSLERGGAEGSFSYGGAVYEVRFDTFENSAEDEQGIIIILQDVTERQKMDNMQVDFVANVSHELKTPLTSIKGYTETLLEGGLEDKTMAHEFLGIINSETDRMNRLVKDLLQLTRLDTKRMKFNMTESDIVSLVRMAIRKMEMIATTKNQQLNRIFDENDSILVIMDRDRVEQAILNLLSNAIKYTKEQGRIDVDIIRGDAEVKIVVLDNGVGIPENEQSRIFERFFRVDKARSGSIGGTGLGLSITKQIVEEHRGNIEIDSVYGKGTKASITLPLPFVRGIRNIE